MFLHEPSPVRPRPLRPHERAQVLSALAQCAVAPSATCAEAVAKTVLEPHRFRWMGTPRAMVAQIALSSGADGITLGCRVYVQPRLFGPGGDLPLDLVAHEVAHVAQYLRDGHVTFLARYLAAYATGRARGLSDRRSYLAIPYEVEARRVAAAVDEG